MKPGSCATRRPWPATPGYGLSAAQREAALDRHPQVTAERRTAFRQLTDAKGLAVLAGEAGTGKSTTLAAVRDAYETAGYRVIGMAWTNQVVQNLQQDGFGDATTVAAELYRLDSGATRWDSRTVLIVDEAGMLSTKHLAASDRAGAGGRRQIDPRRRRQAARQHRARRPVRGAQGDSTAAPNCTRSCGCPTPSSGAPST